MADFNKFLEDNAVFKGYLLFCRWISYTINTDILCSEGAANLNDMKDMLASLPQYQEQREKASTLLAEKEKKNTFAN